MPQSPREPGAGADADSNSNINVDDQENIKDIKWMLTTVANSAMNLSQDCHLAEILKCIASLFVGVCVAPLYLEATKLAPWYTQASSIASNTIENTFMGKSSLDFFQKLLREQGGKKKFFALLALAFISCIPFSIICFFLSKHKIGYRIFEALVTQVGGTVVYMFSLTQLKLLWNFLWDLSFYVRNMLGRVPSEEIRNRQRLAYDHSVHQKCSTVLDHINLEGFSTTGNSERLPLESLSPQDRVSVLSSTLKALSFIVLCIALSLGTAPYTCDTEKALRELGCQSDNWFSRTLFCMGAWPAFVTALTLMFFQYALNVTGAKSLVDSTWNVLGQFFHWQFNNDLKLGSRWIKSTRVILPFLAIAVASFSGYTTGELKHESCSSSKLSWPMHFPGMRQFVTYSAAAFNAIYVGMALEFFLTYCVKYFLGNSSDVADGNNASKNAMYRNYKNMLEAIVSGPCDQPEEVRLRSDSNLSMQTIGENCRSTATPSSSSPGFFANARRTVSSGLFWLRHCGKGYKEVAASASPRYSNIA